MTESLTILTAEETTQFFENQPSLVFCEQNEYARFGTGTNRQHGGTGGMESCSAAFLWNKDTHESYVFHTHYGTDWAGTKQLFQQLCAEGNWEITPASGKARGAWEFLEKIAQEMQQETNGRIISKPTAHITPDKAEYHALTFAEQRSIPHHSYMQDSATGEVTGFHEETLHVYWNKAEYADIFNDNSTHAFTNGFQYITRIGTIPVCSFDGKQHTNAAPQLENTAEMQQIWEKCEEIVVKALTEHCTAQLGDVTNAKNPEERAEKIASLKGGLDPREHPAYRDIIAQIANPESGILKPQIYQSREDSIALCAGQVWRGFFNNLDTYAEKAIEQMQAKQQ